MKPFFLDGPQDYRLMNQTGVRQFRYPENSTHNAIWDSNVSPDGVLYFALASEICTNDYVRLCRYNYDANTVTECFRVEDVILPSDRTIRASKFHSSICFMEDGRLVMTTHTTDKSPEHPTWMPEAYYHHIWEGYPGSNIVVYDPAAGKAENLGVPVPRETIYGSIYEPAHRALFFTGMFRGHLYRYSFDDRRVKDLGRVSEQYSFRLTLGPDGNIYGASKTGWTYKVDTETLTVTDLGYQPPHHPQAYTRDFTNLSIGRTGPDGRVYFAVMYSRQLISLDPATGTFREEGDVLPFAEQYCRGQNRHGVFGMDFDSQGVLWYVITGRNDGSECLEYGLPAGLFRWDITRGGKPEFMGIAGTKDRVASWNSEVCISKDDVMYIIGSNHGTDGPDVTAVDLAVYRPHMRELGGSTADTYYLPDHPHTVEMGRFLKDLEEISAANPFTVPNRVLSRPALLWRALAPDHIDDSPVKALLWQNADVLVGLCGGRQDYVFTMMNGELQVVVPVAQAEPSLVEALRQAADPLQAPVKADSLPHYPGRQYKATATASAPLTGGRTVVGTADGMLAVASDKGVFALGPAANNGPVRYLSATPDGRTVYGVGGDRDDLGVVFRYDDRTGLRWLGHAQFDREGFPGSFNLCLMSCCAVSPDGRKLAVGAGDRLGTVVLYEL